MENTVQDSLTERKLASLVGFLM